MYKILALLIAALLLAPVGVIYAARLSTNAVFNRGSVVAEGPSAESHLLVGLVGSEIVSVIVANGMSTVIVSDQGAKSVAADSLAVKDVDSHP
jgi:hypothetical protein